MMTPTSWARTPGLWRGPGPAETTSTTLTDMAETASSASGGGPRLVDPTSTHTSSGFSLAPRRFRDLNGKTVGLLNSTKFNSDHLLDGIGELLEQRYALKGLVRDTKRSFGTPIPDDHAKEMAEQCDVVITAVGD
jgi:hypothetical protein